MTDRAFIDTNVFVYVYDEQEPIKRAIALRLIERAGRDGSVISTQVLSEFYVALTRRLRPPVGQEVTSAAVQDLLRLDVVPVDADLVLGAIERLKQHQLSYWDSLIIGAAARAGCVLLLTEDLHHGAIIDGVRIENPFLTG